MFYRFPRTTSPASSWAYGSPERQAGLHTGDVGGVSSFGSWLSWFSFGEVARLVSKESEPAKVSGFLFTVGVGKGAPRSVLYSMSDSRLSKVIRLLPKTSAYPDPKRQRWEVRSRSKLD